MENQATSNEKKENSPKAVSVRRCAHGNIHLTLNHVTIALSEKEFSELTTTLTRAYLRFGIHEAINKYSCH